MNTDALQLRAPDLIEPVIGYRQWRVAEASLMSLTCDETWRAPILVARCHAEIDHPQEAPPASGCSCGIYAWYQPCPRTASAGTRDYVAGAVVLWGAIELHASGMRAQHCRIVALTLPLSRWGKRDRVVDVARHLGVPAVRHRHLRAVASEQGLPLPTGLRPPDNWGAASRVPIGVIPRTASTHGADQWSCRSLLNAPGDRTGDGRARRGEQRDGSGSGRRGRR
jgi:hypothetical protein